MPNRLIREGLLESEAVLSMPVEARWLYISILLSADDVGLFAATHFKLARRADIRRDHAEKFLDMLVGVDLIRLYSIGSRLYGFIPRFRQRIQIKRTRYPLPTDALMHDDEDAINKINTLGSKTTVGQPLYSSCASVAQPSEPEPEPEPEPEVEPKKKRNTRAASGARVSLDDMIAEGVDRQHAADWLAVRKIPLTQTAWAGVKREAEKAGVSVADAVKAAAEHGWRGFKADWLRPVANTNGRRPTDIEPEWRRLERERNEAFLGPYAIKRNDPNTIDMEPTDGTPSLLG